MMNYIHIIDHLNQRKIAIRAGSLLGLRRIKIIQKEHTIIKNSLIGCSPVEEKHNSPIFVLTLETKRNKKALKDHLHL